MKPAEIAEILGRTNTYINKELSGIERAANKWNNYGKQKQKNEQTTEELLRDLLIVQLGLAGG